MSATAVRAAALFHRTPELYLAGEAVLCPEGHALPETVIELPHGLRQCRATEKHLRYGRPCAAWIWVFQHGDGTRTVVPVTADEARVIGERVMTIAAVRDFLRLRLAR